MSKEIKEKESVQDRVQNEAKLSIENNGGRGLLAMCTGSGKSRIPIMYAKDKANKVKSMAILVPTEVLRDTGWKNEFKKWKATTLYKKCDLFCYASASKVKGNKYDLVVMDEAHNVTELSREFFEDNEVRDIIALTATPPEKEEKQDLLQSLGLQTTFSLTLDEGINLGIISPIHIHLIYTKLETEKKTVRSGSEGSYFYQTEEKAYKYHNDCVDYAYKTFNGQKIKFSVLNRTRFIYNLKSKELAAKEILELLEEERNLIFCGSVKQADSLSPHSFHYKSGKESLKMFIDEEINELSCVQSLNEGHNLPMIDNAIIAQLNSNALNLIQRIGRVCRWREGHEANVYLLVCEDTQDKIWAEKALAGFNPENITKYNNLKQFKNEFEANYRV